MATREFAKAKMEREVPANPGMRLRNPHIVVNPKRDRKLVEKPASDAKHYAVTEINLYGP
jgi:hypothetical protein